MKSFLVNLLIVLSLALCGFNAYQWQREARLRGDLEKRGNEVFQKATEVQNLQQSLSLNSEEIKRLESIRESLALTLKSNRTELVELRQENEKLRRASEVHEQRANQIEQQYKGAFEKANENLRQQNEIIQSQNTRMKELADERNEMVTRFNKLAADYKSLGDDYARLRGMYTNLVAQVQANQRR